MFIYCTYLTVYSGNKLPPFYIGSSRIDKIYKGYKGSVKSRKYKEVWKKELKTNPHLFSTRILKTFEFRSEALASELKLQKALSVVDNPLYTNQWYAGGIFGFSRKGKESHNWGKVRYTEDNPNPFLGKKHTPETRQKLREINLGRKATEATKRKMIEAQKKVPRNGLTLSEDTKKKISENKSNKYIWITDGYSSKLHSKEIAIPSGWWRGRTLTEEQKLISISNLGTYCIPNKESNKK